MIYVVRQEYTNKGEEEEERKLMAWIEVYGLLKFIEQSENSVENQLFSWLNFIKFVSL